MAYSACDFIISRAGAIAIAEIIASKKPAIFIPLPSAAQDHQTKNALAVTSKDAALLIKESELDVDFELSFSALLNDQQLQNRLSENIKKLALINATATIVDEVEKMIIR